MIAALLLAAMAVQDGPPIIVTGPAPANAQTPATMVVEPAAVFVVACDADGDAETTRSELSACIARVFPAAGARYLAYGDWARRWLGDANALPSPQECDRNGDDTITLDEVQAQFSRLFSRYDANRDGAVTRAEALTVRATPADRDGPRPESPPPGGKRGKPPRR